MAVNMRVWLAASLLAAKKLSQQGSLSAVLDHDLNFLHGPGLQDSPSLWLRV